MRRKKGSGQRNGKRKGKDGGARRKGERKGAARVRVGGSGARRDATSKVKKKRKDG